MKIGYMNYTGWRAVWFHVKHPRLAVLGHRMGRSARGLSRAEFDELMWRRWMPELERHGYRFNGATVDGHRY